MKIIHENDPTLPIVKLKFIFKNSGRLADSIPGTASMLARLLNEGVDESFFANLEVKAIELSFESSFSLFSIEIKCLKEQLSFALEALCELLQKPRFDESLLNRLKITAKGELASLQSDYDYLARRLLNKSVFKDPAFATGTDGDAKSIDSLKCKDLQTHMKENLVLKRLHIEVGGDIKEDEFKLFDPILACFEEGCPKDASFSLTLPKKEAKEFVKTEQAYIYFTSPFFIKLDGEDAYLAKIALFILGAGGFGSRVMEEIRVKRGLAYSAYASLDASYLYSRVSGFLQTKNENAKEAKSLIRQIFTDFFKKGATQSELDGAKSFLIKCAPLKYESLASRLNLATQEYLNSLNPGHFKAELKLFEKASLKDLNSFLSKHEELLDLFFASVENEDKRK